MWIIIPIQIFFLDLLLGADNAVVIGMACRSLQVGDIRKAVFLGSCGAIVFRLLLTVGASFLLTVPYVRLAGAFALMVIAINVSEQVEQDQSGLVVGATAPPPVARGNIWSAMLLIILVDAAMSLDNIVALAVVARGNIWLLAAGVVFSIPVLVFGGVILVRLLQRLPVLVTLGSSLLGWIAGDMAISDPVLADWANAQAPALVLMAPVLGAVFVFVQTRFAAADRKTLGNVQHAPQPELAKGLRKGFAGRLPPPPVDGGRARKIPAKIDAEVLVPMAEDHGLGASAPMRQDPTTPTAPEGNTRDDRIMLIGLLLVTTIVGGLIGCVIYLNSVYMP
jgi:YjbE family integral membrane protein